MGHAQHPPLYYAVLGITDRLADVLIGVRLGDRLVPLAAWPLIAALTAYNAYPLYADSGQIPLLQGRYWFGAMVAFAVLIALGLRWMPLAVVALIAIAHVVAIATIAGYFWGPPGTPVSDRVRTMIVWSPFPGDLLVAGFVVAVLVVAGTLVALMRELNVLPEQLFPPRRLRAGRTAGRQRPAHPGGVGPRARTRLPVRSHHLGPDEEGRTMTATVDGRTGNTYDKYAFSNPIERRLMAGFMGSLDDLFPATAPASVLEVGLARGRRVVGDGDGPGLVVAVGRLDDGNRGSKGCSSTRDGSSPLSTETT